MAFEAIAALLNPEPALIKSTTMYLSIGNKKCWITTAEQFFWKNAFRL